MSYRQAKPQEIADCIKLQVVDACDLAETEAYKNKPAKLRSLIRDIKTCAISNAQWVAAQHWGANQSDAAPELLEACKNLLSSAPDMRDGVPPWSYPDIGPLRFAEALRAAHKAIRQAEGAPPAKRTPGVRIARRSRDYIPTIDGIDTSPTFFDEGAAMREAIRQAEGTTP